MKRIWLFAMVILFGLHTNVYGRLYLDGKCISDDVGSQCGWCDPTGTPPPGNCKKGYAGCMNYGYIADRGAYFTDQSGNRIEQQTTLPYGQEITTWRCGSNGWTESRWVNLIDGCDEYTYFDAMLGKCVSCPSSGVFDDKGMEMPVRGDYSYQKLSGCYYYGLPGHTYHDETGTMIFEAESACHNDGYDVPVPSPEGN